MVVSVGNSPYLRESGNSMNASEFSPSTQTSETTPVEVDRALVMSVNGKPVFAGSHDELMEHLGYEPRPAHSFTEGGVS